MIFTPNIKIDSFAKIDNLFYGFETPLGGYLPFLLLLKYVTLIVPGWIVQKIILFLIFFLAGLSAHNLLPTRHQLRRYFAGLIYMLNPFIYVRFMVGHWLILLAYAVMPFAVKVSIDFFEDRKSKAILKVVLLLTLIGVFSPHILLLSFLVFLAFFFVKLPKAKNHVSFFQGFGIIFILFFLLNVFWIVPALTGRTFLAEVSYEDLLAFTARAWGIGFNTLFAIASMHGFWRPPEGYTYISDILPYWWLFYIFILFLAIHGFLAKYKDENMGSYIKALGAVAIISLILATGISTPYFSDFFKFIFYNVPFFKGFREPQKFVALLALTYSYLGGLGIAELSKEIGKKNANRKRLVTVSIIVLALASPLIYSLNMLGGFNNQLQTIDYPTEWYEVNNFLNQQEKDFNILFFPWHMYMAFSWTGRVIANPASGFYDRPVIQGENIEVGTIETQSPKPTQHYIHFLLNHRDKIKNFGELVAPLNVKYIILAKEVDYREYDFLYSQRDLKVVLDNPKMAVFENQCKTAKVYWVKDIMHINNWEGLLKETPPERVPLNYVQLSPVEYEVEVPFNNGYVVLTEPYNEGWRLNGEKPAPNLGLTNAFYVEKPGTYRIYFQKFNTLLAYYLISLTTFLASKIYLVKDKVKPLGANRILRASVRLKR
jgi:hypothetical protein